jgi:hypothetical protein
VLTLRMLRRVVAKRRHLGAFLMALPALLLLVSSWVWGEVTGYWTGTANGVTPAQRQDLTLKKENG